MIDVKRVFTAVSSKKATVAAGINAMTMTGRRRVRPFLASSFLQRPPPASLLASTLPACKMVHGASILPVFLGNKNAACSYNSSFSTAAAVTANTAGTHQQRRTPFLLADIGEGIKEVELLTWFVKAGDYVHEFDKICEVQSDKATVEITSRYHGVVDALAGNVGDMVQVGQPLLYLVNTAAESSRGDSSSSTNHSADEDAATNNSATTNNSSAATTSTTTKLQDTETVLPELWDDERLRIPTVASHYHLKSDDDDYENSSNNGKFAASPAVRKLGKEYKLDLSTIHGSGPRGRLLKSDVLIYLQEQGRRIASPSPPPPSTTTTTTLSTTPPTVLSESSLAVQSNSEQQQHFAGADVNDEEYEVVQLKGYNRLMVQSMTKALKIPHMGFGDEIIVDNLMKCRHDLINDPSMSDNKLSLMAFLCKACSLALTEFPLLNSASVVMEDVEGAEATSSSTSSTAANTLHVYKEHRLGIAMDTPRGLVVPVIRHVQKKSILEIQNDLTRFKELAANNKLSATELSIAPTFTLSNIGALGCGGMTLQPVIVPPQVAMGAMGRIQKVPRYITGDNNDSKDILQPVHVMHVTWAGDHRYLDGATLARFHQRFSHYLQQPTRMLLHLK